MVFLCTSVNECSLLCLSRDFQLLVEGFPLLATCRKHMVSTKNQKRENYNTVKTGKSGLTTSMLQSGILW